MFVAGYLDAVRNVTGIHGLGAQYIPTAAANAPPATGARIEYWGQEFGAFAEQVLHLDQRSRLGFYLVDYMCWFRELTSGAECFRQSIPSDDAPAEIMYRLVWPDGQCVMVSAILARHESALPP